MFDEGFCYPTSIFFDPAINVLVDRTLYTLTDKQNGNRTIALETTLE